MRQTDSSLDDRQVACFSRDGYVIVPSLFDQEEMADIAAWTEELVQRPEIPGEHMAYYEDHLHQPGVRVLSCIENFCPFQPGLKQLLCGPPALDYVAQLFGGPAVLFKDKINFKLPGADGFKAHQDVQAEWDSYASLHITMLVSIDDSTPENGCLELVPGKHRSGRLGPMWEPLADDAFDDAYVSYPTRSGDVVFFDSFAPHRSAANTTSEPRRILYLTYNLAANGDHRVQYYADKRASFPPDCERDPDQQYVFRV